MARFFEIYVEDKQYLFQEEDLPLTIGTGPEVDVSLPVATTGAGVSIDLHDGQYLFLNSTGEPAGVFHNDQLVSERTWIKSGDSSRIGDQLLKYRISGDRVEILVEQYTGPDIKTAIPEIHSLGTVSESMPIPAVGPGSDQQNSRLKRNIITAVLFALLLPAALFILTAHTLEVKVEPVPDTLRIEGTFPLLTIGERYLGVAGSYTLHASRSQYQDLEQKIAITPGGQAQYVFQMEPLPGTLSVTSVPAGAEVFVDGSRLGKVPLQDQEVRAGSHMLRCSLAGYQILEQAVELTPAGHAAVECMLRPAMGRVFTVTDPPGAMVSEGDQQFGRTPLTLSLEPGEHSLVLAKADYMPNTLKLTVESGKTLTPSVVTLHRKTVQVALQSRPKGARVLDGKKKLGTTPLQLNWVPGSRHTLAFSLSGYVGVVRKVVVEEKSNTLISVTLKKKTAKKKKPQKEVDRAPIQTDSSPEKAVTGSRPTQPVAAQSVSGPQMVLVSPGTFTMGASRREPGRRANEGQHTVTLTRSFLLGRHEVTNKEFRRFKPTHRAGTIGGQSLDADKSPVVKVDWQDAVRYCNWLSRRQGLVPFYRKQGAIFVPRSPATNGYRLPFEAEWAFAARMIGRTRPGRYSWDGGFPPRRPSGNYADESARTLLPVVIKGYYDGFPVLAPVESFPRNMGGLFDMGGNVSEWCHDYYSPSPGNISGKNVDPTGPQTGRFHVVRGSSWRDGAMTELRLSYRWYTIKGRDNLGFRVARYSR